MAHQGTVKTTCPRDCYDACGIVVVLKDGVIANVRGDPDHPTSRGALCQKCAIVYNGAYRDEHLRLSTPLRRTGPKGSGTFEAVSWDVAFGEIAARLKPIVDAGDGSSILNTHYTGTFALVGFFFPMRFMNKIGATEVDPDTVCNKAGHTALNLTFGESMEGFDPQTATEARTILIWGANPSHSAIHQDKVFVDAAKERGTKIIVVDPISHKTARAADLHLKLAPGTDSALAFALLNVMIGRELIDRPFLNAHVLGWEEMLPEIEAMTASKAADICGIPEDVIVEAALAYAEGPSLLWLGQGFQRQTGGGNMIRCLSALVAFTGNIGKPGAGFVFLNGPDGPRGMDVNTVMAPHLAPDGTGAISHMDFAAVLEDPSRSKVLFNWNNNPAASSPEQRRLRRALEREDLFHVAIDLFHTDTTRYADFVLPAASFLEYDDLVVPYFDLTLSAQVKAGEPIGQSLPNSEIFRRLAAAMGYNDPELFESDHDIIARLLAQSPYQGSFEDLKRAGTVTLFPEPRVQFEDLAFPTPSGKIELVSAKAEKQGFLRSPRCVVDPRPAQGRLRILSPSAYLLLNSSYGNDLKIRKLLGAPTVTLHPSEATARGLVNGEDILLENESGRLSVKVAISDDAQPGIGIVYKGHWPSDSVDDANVNILVSGRKSDIGESTCVHSVEVDVITSQA